jgi:hypothetical protein
VAITCESSFYILKYSKETVNNFLASGGSSDEDGLEEAFEFLHEIPERYRPLFFFCLVLFFSFPSRSFFLFFCFCFVL